MTEAPASKNACATHERRGFNMRVLESGQVQVTVNEILSVQFVPFAFGVDSEGCDPTKACGRSTAISGFAEWIGQSSFPISIGWDWHLEIRGEGVHLCRTDQPRTNVRLTDSEGRQLEWEQNLQVLGTIVDALPWLRQADVDLYSLCEQWHQD